MSAAAITQAKRVKEIFCWKLHGAMTGMQMWQNVNWWVCCSVAMSCCAVTVASWVSDSLHEVSGKGMHRAHATISIVMLHCTALAVTARLCMST